MDKIFTGPHRRRRCRKQRWFGRARWREANISTHSLTHTQRKAILKKIASLWRHFRRNVWASHALAKRKEDFCDGCVDINQPITPWMDGYQSTNHKIDGWISNNQSHRGCIDNTQPYHTMDGWVPINQSHGGCMDSNQPITRWTNGCQPITQWDFGR